jgi:2-iminobutanoate/2-iminopropanoate deaminase
MKHIHTDNAPTPVGPYSQAYVSNGLVFCAGQVGLDPRKGKLVEGAITEQTHQVIKNLQAVLEAGGSSLQKVVKTTCFLQTMDDYKAFNVVYNEYFSENKPARSTVEVVKLPLGALVEIEAIAETSE